MQRRGVRVVLRLGPAGQPEFALIRQGGPIPPSPPHHKGLGAGAQVGLSPPLANRPLLQPPRCDGSYSEIVPSDCAISCCAPSSPSQGGRQRDVFADVPKSSSILSQLSAPHFVMLIYNQVNLTCQRLRVIQLHGPSADVSLLPGGWWHQGLVDPSKALTPALHHRAGSLLVASRRLDGTLFGGSVVLITEHSAAGARGVILNRPYEGGAAGALGGAAGRRASAREHFGGPVSGAQAL